METRNSPAMTPTSDNPMLIFSELNSVAMLDGSTIFTNIWNRFAPKVRAICIRSRSVPRKPLSISSTVTIIEMASAMTIIAFIPAPTQIIITGPSAIFGRLFSTTRYGSITRDKNGDHQRITASSPPNAAPSRKPISVSVTVTPMCISRLLDAKFAMVFRIRDGWLMTKLSIIPIRAKISQTATSTTNMEMRITTTAAFLRLIRFR